MTVASLLWASVASAQTPAAPPPPAPPAPAQAPEAAPAVAPQPAAPQDPYGSDPVLNEQIAESLVGRAQELLDAKIYVDAKQLAVEALVKSPKGNSADRAHYIIKVVNDALGIKDDPPPAPPSQIKPDEHLDLSPITDPTAPLPTPAQPRDEGRVDGKTSGMVHGALYGGVLGAMIGAYAGGDNPASVAVPAGIALGVGGALVSRPLVRKLDWDEAQVRTAGSASLWGGVMGGLMAGAITGAGDGPPSSKGVLLGASIGSTIGLAAGGAFAREGTLTRGDVALMDTLGGIGAVGGLTMGMLMQPAQPEAYAVNSMLGAAGGLIVGYIAAPQTNTTPRRMLRVAGLSAAGGALPFLLYAGIYDKGTNNDEQVVGFLSSAGLVAGAYLGFRLTRNLDVGLDVHHDKPGTSGDDAPAAAVSRNSDGSWTVGGLGFRGLDYQLSNRGRGMTFTLLGATF